MSTNLFSWTTLCTLLLFQLKEAENIYIKAGKHSSRTPVGRLRSWNGRWRFRQRFRRRRPMERRSRPRNGSWWPMGRRSRPRNGRWWPMGLAPTTTTTTSSSHPEDSYRPHLQQPMAIVNLSENSPFLHCGSSPCTICTTQHLVPSVDIFPSYKSFFEPLSWFSHYTQGATPFFYSNALASWPRSSFIVWLTCAMIKRQ